MAKTGFFVCTGVTATDGCGAELTLAERRLYDGRCELCALDWDERVRAWRFGHPDPALDEHFLEGHAAPARVAAPRRAKAA